ncbi:MAG: EAL domain-containing protein, partial [Candidatus Eremiobacteraeota bacterium]|nr:EAL domain-containing protein [Candidatus Eremiobacteraeota bacterium]
FVLLLSELSTQDEASVMTAAVVKRVYQKLRQPFMVDEHSVQVGMSMGVSIYPSDARNGEEMFEHSALALQKAKEKGKSQCQYFRAELQDQHEARAELDAQLKRGLEQDQFQMQYQPIFDLKAGQVIGLEALMRWNHPQHGILNPDSFLKVAEDSGLIVLIGNWAVRSALKHAAEWHRHGVAGFVSINLSKRQLMQSELVPSISSMMAEFGCVPDRVLFEVPEAVTGPEHPQIRETLVELTKTGAKLAIDNFGTSSTSLQDLRRGPFTVIKVDRKFVRGLPGNEENTGIVLSALNMGHHLGRISVAVGVESEPERKWLEQTGCLYAQGNALSAPMAAEQVSDFVKRS